MKAETYFTGKPCKRGHIAARYLQDRNCIECAKVRKAEAYAANPERWHVRSRAWQKANRKRSSYHTRNWQKRNEQKDKARKAAYRESEAGKAKLRIASKAWQKKNAAKIVAYVQKRDAIKRNAPGRGVTDDQWLQVVDEALGICAYCNASAKLTMDHIEPIMRGGAHDIENIAAACKRCNCSKHDTPLLLWLARRKG